MVAANAKYSVLVNKIIRTVTEQNSQKPALINNSNEQAAEWNMVNVFFFHWEQPDEKV